MSSTPHDAPGAAAAHTHESSDFSLTPVIVAGIGLVILLTVAAAAMLGLFDGLAFYEAKVSPPANPLAAAEGPRLPPQPRLQAHPLKDLEELRKAEQQVLTSYAWVDQSAGIARIPVTRAMEILAQRAGATGDAPR
jgi:hypothetical protein